MDNNNSNNNNNNNNNNTNDPKLNIFAYSRWISNKTSKASLRVCTHEKPFTIEESRNPSPPPPYIQYMRYNTHARVTRWAQSWLNNGDRIIEGRPSVRLIQLDIPVYTGFILENLIEFEGVAATQPDYHRINTLPLPNVGFIVRQM